MSRKHFQSVAASFAFRHRQLTKRLEEDRHNSTLAAELRTVELLAEDVATELAQFNTNFNRQRFLDACRGK
jgi:hypothetical protein